VSARFFSCLCLLALSLAACSDEPTSPPPGGAGGEGGAGGSAQPGSGGAGGQGGSGGQGGHAASGGRVIVGVSHPPDEPYIHAAWLHVVMKADGAVIREETLGTGESAPIALPLEYAFEDLPDGAEVELVLARDLTGSGPLLERARAARTRVVEGRTSLLRVTLSDDACPDCDPGLTCNWGRCLDPYVAPELLEDYSADWADHSWCKPRAPIGAPTVVVGSGLDAFTPLDDQDELPIHAGDQGGHHVFLALRMRGLRQASIAKLSAEVSGVAGTIGPLSSIAVFPDDPAAGHCETTGILFQIDTLHPIDDLLGKPIQITAEVLDADGDSALVTGSGVLATEPQYP